MDTGHETKISVEQLDTIANMKTHIMNQLNEVRAQVMPQVMPQVTTNPFDLNTRMKDDGINRKARRAYKAALRQRPGKLKTRAEKRK